MESLTSESEPVEFSLSRWPAIFLWLLFAWSLASILYPSSWIILFRWPVGSALFAGSFAWIIPRNSSWSPLYLGPTFRIDASGISGRGGWFHSPWHVSWPQFDHATSGRNGIFVYRNDVEPWRSPFMQVGPFNYSGGTIIKIINARATMFKQAGNGPS